MRMLRSTTAAAAAAPLPLPAVGASVCPPVSCVVFSPFLQNFLAFAFVFFVRFLLRTAAFTRVIFVHSACKSDSWH